MHFKEDTGRIFGRSISSSYVHSPLKGGWVSTRGWVGVRDEAIGRRLREEEGSAIQRTLHTRSLWQENGKEYFILFWGKGGVNCAVLLKPGKHLINRSKGKGGRGGRKKSCERKEEG